MKSARAERGEFAGVANRLCPDVIPKIKSGVGLMDLDHPGRGLAELKDPEARGRHVAFNRAMDTTHRAAMDAYLVDSLDQVAACFRDMCAGFKHEEDNVLLWWMYTDDVPKVKAQLANICALSEERFGSRDAFYTSFWLDYFESRPRLNTFEFRSLYDEDEGLGPPLHEMDQFLQGLDTPKKKLFVATTVMSRRCMSCAAPSRFKLPSDPALRLPPAAAAFGMPEVMWTRCGSGMHAPRLTCHGCAESQAIADDHSLLLDVVDPLNINYNCAWIMAEAAGKDLNLTLNSGSWHFVLLFNHPVLGGSLQEHLGLDDSEVASCRAEALEEYAEAMFNSGHERRRREDTRRKYGFI